MKFFTIHTSKKHIKYLYKIVDSITSLDDLKNYSELSLNVIDDKCVEYSYENVKGKIRLDNNNKPYLFSIFDIFDNKNNLIKSAYHYNLKNIKNNENRISVDLPRTASRNVAGG